MKRICLGLPGYRCRALIVRGPRCDSCRRAFARQRDALRPSFERNLYGSAAWKRLRAQVLAESDGICAHCRRAPAVSADHLRTVREAPHLALDRSNVVPSCRSCQERRKRPAQPRQTTMYEVMATPYRGTGSLERRPVRVRPLLAALAHTTGESKSGGQA